MPFDKNAWFANSIGGPTSIQSDCVDNVSANLISLVNCFYVGGSDLWSLD